MIKQITEGYVSVDSIALVGHTDRLGSETYNYDLELKRAQTVKSYLEQNGVTAPISASSARRDTTNNNRMCRYKINNGIESMFTTR